AGRERHHQCQSELQGPIRQSGGERLCRIVRDGCSFRHRRSDRLAGAGMLSAGSDVVKFQGKAWTFGRNVNTDLIFPKVWFRPTYEPGEMASHLMVGIDEDFPRKVSRGDIIVG